MSRDHEDILRRVLHEESTGLQPAPGAWERIESRAAAAHRRRHVGTRVMVAMGTAAAVLVGVVAVNTLTGDDGTKVQAGPADVPVSMAPGPPVPEAGQEAAGDAPGIWPFRTGPESDSISTDVWNDPVYTAERFLRDYVGFTRLIMGEFAEGDSRSGEVTATTRDRGPVTTVFVRRLGSGQGGPWTVVGAATDNIVLERPTALEAVTSPVRIEGRSTAFEGNVVVEVRADGQTAADGELGLAPLTGGSMGEFGPLVGEVPFVSWPTRADGGAVVAYTDSAMDGALEEASVVRVRFTEALSVKAESRLIAFDETRRELVVVGSDGKVTKVLTRLQDGWDFGGLAVTPDRKTVFLSELPPESSACSAVSRPVRADGHPDPTPELTVRVTRDGGLGAAGRSPAVSPDGKWLAVAGDRDCDGQDELIIEDLRTLKEQPFSDLSDPTGARDARPVRISHLSWSPDGRSIAYEVEYPDGRGVQIHDVSQPETVTGDATRVVSEGTLQTWLRPAMAPRGLMTVGVADCCDEPSAEPTTIRNVRLTNGDTVPDRAGPLGDGLDTGVAIRAMSYRGGDLIVVAGDGAIRRLEDGELRVVASGDYLAAG